MLTKVRKATVALATVKIAAAAEATSSAVSKGRVPARSANRASTSEPTMPAAERFTARVAVGRPHRTTGPGSAISSGAAPPP